jgi:hypothetical protein
MQSSFQLERSVNGAAELYELALKRSYSLVKVLDVGDTDHRLHWHGDRHV